MPVPITQQYCEHQIIRTFRLLHYSCLYVYTIFVVEVPQSSFSTVRHFLPNPGRILPALTEDSKIKKLPLLGIEPTTSRSSL